MKKLLKKRFLLGWSIAVSGLFGCGCGASPLLHHESPHRESEGYSADSDSTEAPQTTCDLYFKTEDLCGQIKWVKVPKGDETGEFLLFFWKKGESPSSPVHYQNPQAPSVGVKLWMPSMGHGSSPVTIDQNQDSQGAPMDGVFRATGIFFVMSGAWDIVVLLKSKAGEVLDSAKVKYSVQ